MQCPPSNTGWTSVLQSSSNKYIDSIDSIDSSDSDIDSFDQKFTILETSRQKVHRHRYHNHEHTTANNHHLSPAQPPVNISPMRHFHKNKSSPVVHQHRRLKKWTRGGKAIDIIPDSNYTRVENRKKRNHPKTSTIQEKEEWKKILEQNLLLHQIHIYLDI